MFLRKHEMFPRKRAAAAAWADIIDRNPASGQPDENRVIAPSAAVLR